MSKQVRIITFCTWTSIGSILQSFALSETVRDLGHRNSILLEEGNRTVPKSKPHSLAGAVKRFVNFFLQKKIRNAHKKRMDFITSHLNVSYFSRYEDFEKNVVQDNADVYLAGSDQIWNPELCSPLFFLHFVKHKKCISYAASMGKTNIRPEKSVWIGEKLEKFAHISVREQECAEVLSTLTDREIDVHIDPTFLMDVERWRRMERPYPVKKPYILVYMLYRDPSCNARIKELKRKTGLPVYAVCSGFSGVWADRHLFDIGIEEFLWLMDHAEYVITSSFHGTAMSVIFNKKFAAVINPASPSRIENLLRVLAIPHIAIEQLGNNSVFSYDAINERISEERRRSMDYLKEAIG